ncbi:MAG: glycosyltransferase family 4 protein [Armatimonadota bacterium]
MKILVISTWFPYPPDNGSKIRIYNLLKYLGTRHTIDLLALTQSERDAGYLDVVGQFCRRISIFPEPRFMPDEMMSWLGFFSMVPRYFRVHHCQEMEAKSIEWNAGENYDAVLAMTLGSAPYVSKLDIPFKLLDQHNVESQVIKRQWKVDESIIRRMRYAPTWMKAEYFERRVAMGFDVISVVSEPESRLMDELLGEGHVKRIDVIPNGVSPEFLEYKSQKREPGLLAFTGALTYTPNYDAAMRLSKDIMPHILAQMPDAKLQITGNSNGIDTSALAAEGVKLTGYVDDIKTVLGSAQALVVPLRYGGGTRLKILEAMALGTPIVSTPMGAEGIGAEDGIHILYGETDKELADQSVRLLQDEELADRISTAAKELVRERYQWPSIAAEFENILKEEVAA